ncbi:hypothetical protein [Microbacterium maritypicum]|uniref:Gram-positive cocci surface proteins LPxTG domain-containing protein n=1 Tax=Microbacterium maritypicum TaxID=33918 RepID=A0AAJ6ANJ5_MICMQ|nr:hypothetical protein [Microbacterium liquefaciens]WEF20844.1 hypothetical protein PWF71_16375 [Microbacterium liquefaciens]
MKHPIAVRMYAWVTVACVLLIAATVLLVSPASASAAGDVAPATTSSAPGPTSTPSPSPTVEETESDDHPQRQNGERPVERDDLGFLGILFVTGMGFVLVAGAVGVAVAGWKRRRRDRVVAKTDRGA